MRGSAAGPGQRRTHNDDLAVALGIPVRNGHGTVAKITIKAMRNNQKARLNLAASGMFFLATPRPTVINATAINIPAKCSITQ